MMIWVVLAAMASIAITAALTYVLWRMNLTALDRARSEDGADGAGD